MGGVVVYVVNIFKLSRGGVEYLDTSGIPIFHKEGIKTMNWDTQIGGRKGEETFVNRDLFPTNLKRVLRPRS